MAIDIPVVVLAGGIGERIKILTSGKPKTLLSLVGKHIVEYVLNNLVGIGVRHVYMVINNPKDFEDIAVRYGKYLEIELIQQKKPDIEGAIISAKDSIHRDFVLLYGDIIAPRDMYQELFSTYIENRYSVVLVPEEDVESYGTAVLDESGSIERFIEKPIHGYQSLYVVGGAYILPKEFIEYVESYGNITEALNTINNRYRLKPCIWSGWWIDVEYPWDLLRASLYILQQIDRSSISSNAKISPNAVIEGPVIIEDDVEIDHYAIIKGPVYIGRKTYVGSHSLVRSYVSIEGDTTIGSYTEIVWSSIQKNTTIGSRSYIGFSVIGFNSVIEPGVITLNILPEEIKIARSFKITRRGREYVKIGAVIGADTRINAYRVLKPGEEVSKL
ncbi:MAG: sugar phosphate nucleotidyltransferase [Ignisphaera sp.]